ncbi:uncharacterized protein LOC118492183 [Helianthus annuus]|uniref:uncharacterized protein LOC118492183 n=1 Tax=Helianthus annuus TaxID=4232 RepID=UPI00165338B9|nr:uncharacterized protein LOC118492183 [Helianthus annuus]
MGDKTDPSMTLINKLDASDPLYLHASESSGLTIVSIKLKGTENYVVWSNAMKLALMAINKLGFIDGTCAKSKDNDVLAIYSKLASEVWDDLKDTYDKVDGSVVFSLYQKINSVSQNGSSVSEYYHKINTMWKQFDAMLQLPSCTCNASTKFNEFNQLIKLMQFLMGLDDIYQPVRTNLLIRDPLPTIKTAFSIISREESHRGSNSGSKIPNVGFVAKLCNFNDNKKRFNKGPNPNLKCTHCNKIGHTIDKCFELHGYPTNYRQKPNQNGQWSRSNSSANNSNGPSVNNSVCDKSASSLNTLSADQFSKLLGLLNENKTEDINKPNVGDAKVTKIGCFKLSDSVILKDVFVVPEYYVNLISVYKLAKDNKLRVIFDENTCYIQDSCTKKTLVTGRQTEDNSDKLEEQAEKCVFMGYSNYKKGYKVWSLDQRNFIFPETSVFPFKNNSPDQINTNLLNQLNFFDNFETSSDTNPDDEEKGVPDSPVETQQHSDEAKFTVVSDAHHESISAEPGPVRAESSSSNDESNLPEGTQTIRRSSRPVSAPKRCNDFVVGHAKYSYDKFVDYSNLPRENIYLAANVNKIVEPSTYKDVVKDKRWIDAMNEELSALHRNNTWEIVDLPSGKNTHLRSNINPKVRSIDLRLGSLLKDLTNERLDVNNAFLYGHLKVEVYMSLPDDLSVKHQNKVCKLNKSLYGLKQAPRMWNERLVQALVKIGFVQSKCDHSMFIMSKNDVFVVLLVYVDDIVLIGNNEGNVNEGVSFTKKILHGPFK